MTNIELQLHAKEVRKDIILSIYQAQSGHPGGSLGCVDILTELYFEEMDISSENVDSIDRDRFVLSKGHACPALYSVLAEKNLLDKELLSTLRKLGSPLQGHPCMNKVKGVDMSTGSLGQGISTAVGMALANKLDHNDHRIYVLLGDGECQEGEVWEAVESASVYELDNLCILVDNNGLQLDGQIHDEQKSGRLAGKFEAFGCSVQEIDGHSFDQIRTAFSKARSCKGKPSVIITHTVKGKGVSFMENQVGWHGKAPNEKQKDLAIFEIERG